MRPGRFRDARGTSWYSGWVLKLRRPAIRSAWSTLALVLCSTLACASSKGAGDETAASAQGGVLESAQAPQPEVNPNMKPMKVDASRCDIRGKRTRQNDLNADRRADMVAIIEREGEAISCKQADLNFDGSLDAFLHYDDKGELVREQYDRDYDGRIDFGRYFKDGELFLDEQDANHDGYVDSWRRYDKGRLTRIDHDRDFDGKPDLFMFYVAGQIDRVGYDLNGDGKVDKWDQDIAARARDAYSARQRALADAEAEEADEFVEEPPAEENAETSEGDKKQASGKGKGKSDAKKADAKKADAKKADAKKADAKKTDAKTSGKADAENKKPGEPAGEKPTKPDAKKPDAKQPDAKKPDAKQPS